MTLPFFTIGHSDRTFDDFAALLDESDIARVVDVRKLPGSRANPQFDEDTLRRHLARSGRSYEHLAALGGLRGKTTGVAPDVNALWTNRSFHRYADYALTPAFRTGLEHLLREGHQQRCAIMCAEAVWWRCHRRIVADHLLACGETVLHIMGHGRIEPARLTPGAVVQPDGALVYPAEVGA